MKQFRSIILTGTILPSLLISNMMQVQYAVAAPAGILDNGANRNEEELKRRQQEQRPPAPEQHRVEPQAPRPPAPEQHRVEPQAPRPPAPEQHRVEPQAPRPPAPEQHRVEPQAPRPPAPEQHRVEPQAPRPPAAEQHRVEPQAPRPPAPEQHRVEPQAPRPPAPEQHRVEPQAPRPPAPEQNRVEPQPPRPPAPEQNRVEPQAPRPPVAPNQPVPPKAPDQPNSARPTPVPPPAPQPPAPNGVRPQPPLPGQPPAPQPPAPNGVRPGAPAQPPAPEAPPPHLNGPATMAPPAPPPVPQKQGDNRRRGMTPLEAGVIGAAVGVVGGMIIGEHVRDINEVQRTREVTEGNGATFYSEPGRVIVREGDRLYVRHDEMARFREFGRDVRVQQRGDDYYQTVERPDGVRIITVTDRNGELIRRIRQMPDGREYILVDNAVGPRPTHFSDEVIVVPPPRIEIPQDRYVVDANDTEETTIYETLTAPPVQQLPRRYTLDQVRYSRDLRSYMPSVDLNTITFSTGSWAIEDSEVSRLQVIADAINRAIQANPNEVYLIEGHTDAVGNAVDNLSLSDRRAQAVATILTKNFNVPPENLVTQGYGAQYLKVQTSEANRENRRVVVRRITPLLAANGQQQQK